MKPSPHVALAGLVLAAGASRRMGAPKGAVQIGGATFVARVLDGLVAARLDPIAVVVGVHREALIEALPSGLRVDVVVNPRPERGQLSSLKIGLRELLAIAPEVAGVVVALVDHATVLPATVAALAQVARNDPAPIIVPRYAGRRGHPIVVMRSVWAEFLATPDSASARAVVRRDATRVREIAVDDPGVVRDFDTPEDLRDHHDG